MPKILHQIFLQGASRLPLALEDNVKALKELNPTWEYRLYDENDARNFILRNYGAEILKYFDRISPLYIPARADLFRYLLMYKDGGVYLDVKSTLTKPLDDVLQSTDEYVLSQWPNKEGERYEGWGLHPEISLAGGEFQQWHIVAVPEHPFLHEVIRTVLWNIDNYTLETHGVGKMGVLRTTGPIAYTQAIVPLLPSHAHRIVDAQADLGFVYSIFGDPHSPSIEEKLAHERIFENHYHRLQISELLILS